MKLRALAVIAGLSLTTAGFALAQQHGGSQGGHPQRQAPDQGSGGQGGQDRPPPPRDGQGQGGQNGQRNGRRPTSRPSPDQIFDRADLNHDGSLSRDEFRQFLEHLPPPPPRDGDRPPPPPKDKD